MTMKERLEATSAKVDVMSDKLDRVIEKINTRKYEDEIQAQAARIRFLQAELYRMEALRRAVEDYFGGVCT